MRSDRDKRSDTEKEIDDFLSKFDSPADEMSADIDSYLDELETESEPVVENNFRWKTFDDDNDKEKQSEDKSTLVVSSAENNAEETGHRRRRRNRKETGKRVVNADSANISPTVPVSMSEINQAAEKISEAEPTEHQTSETGPHKRKVIKDSNPVSVLNNDKNDVVSSKDRNTIVAEEPLSDIEAALLESVSKNDEKVKSASKSSTQPDNKKTLVAGELSELEDKEVHYKRDVSKQKADSEQTKEAEESAAAAQTDAPAEETKKEKKKKEKKERRSIKEVLFLKKNPDYDPSQGDTYEKDGKTIKNKPLLFSPLKLLRDFVVIGFVFFLAGLIFAASIIISAPTYDYKDVYSVVDTSSIIYDDRGKQVDTVFYTENRKIVEYKDMPEDLVNAFIAIEDKTFWKHHGFNWTRMIGAVLSSLTGNGRISGTSTITQQLSRNVYLADIKSVRSIKRKILEMYYAMRLEHALSKEQIIEAYLNTIYLGHGCYGVNAAAKTYFSKGVKDLDLIECASLAALPQSPDTYALLKLASEAQNVVDSKVVATEPDTVVTNDIAKERRQLTLDLMLDQGMITKEQHDDVYDKSLNDFIDPNLKSSSSNYSYFHEYLVDTIIADIQEQYEMDYADAERMVYTKGLQIYSTMDKKAQDVIAKEFQDGSNFPYVTAPRDGEGNLLNNDGKIALYNYKNYFDDDGDFKLSGSDGDVTVNDDGSITINRDHKLHIYETEVGDGIDYSLEFKNYYIYDDNDILYSIAGGYLNVPMAYKTADSNDNVTISADYFSDPSYEGAIKIDGKDVILTEKSYTLSPRARQPQGAMTIVGVGTGEVKAMVGGRQFGGQKVLNRSLNPRQPGSSIKPLAIYGAALQKSYELAEQGKKWKFVNYGIDRQGTKGWGDYVTVHSSIEDERTKIEGKYWPNNFNNSFSGKNTFKTAIQKSINTCAVKLELQIGSDYSVEQLKKFGITTVQDDTSNPVNDVNPAALALGAMTEGVMPLEMALAYASFPGGGKVNTPICYYKVLDRDGNLLLEGKSEQSEAINEGVAWIMTDVLKSVVSYNRYMYVEGFQPGGKTGTTNDQYDIWFDGFSPSYAASIWIGTDENIEMSSMSTPAAALWGKIMNQIPNAKKGEYKDQPSNVINKGGEYFTKGTETGLTSWSDKEAREKAKKAAYKKWLKEREKHKHKVVDVEGHYENKLVTPEKYEERTREVEKTRTVIDPETGEEVTETYTDTETYKEKVADAVYKKVWVDEKWHWEYDKGWRDGDFKYNG